MAFGLVICGMISGVSAALIALVSGLGIGLALLGYMGFGFGGMMLAILATTLWHWGNSSTPDALTDAVHG